MTADFLDDAVRSLAASGIGGKVSSGWGHFDLEMEMLQDPVLLKGLQASNEACQMLISFLLVDLLAAKVLKVTGALDVLIKCVVDGCLFIFSYGIQRKWVFKNKKN